MSNRQVVLDTETTGLKVEEGHRIIEIGCIELIDRQLTGNHYHQYVNPEREVEAGALAVHGISHDFLRDKPLFKEIAQPFIEFIHGAELLIHNAPFDISFLNHELALASKEWRPIKTYCQITDTLQIARRLHAGQRNSLDALCKRYAVDNTKRDYHGALLDASLLAQVYLAMTGGQGNFFDSLIPMVTHDQTQASDAVVNWTNESFVLPLIQASAEELAAHTQSLAMMKEKGACLWLDIPETID